MAEASDTHDSAAGTPKVGSAPPYRTVLDLLELDYVVVAEMGACPPLWVLLMATSK